MGPNDKVTKHGETLTARVWDLLDYLETVVDAPLYVAQGGFQEGGGASASAGTHDYGDVFDLSVRDIPKDQIVRVVTSLRYWSGCAWYRAPEFGWTSTGPHIHCVMRDSYYVLSYGAKQQVKAYDNGRNGLANNGPDPFPQPDTQHHWVMREEVMPTAEEIAKAVWDFQINRAWDNKKAPASTLLSGAHFYSVSGAVGGNIPATANASPNQLTALQKILNAIAAVDTEGVLTDADKDEIATLTLNKMSERLKS